MAMYSAGKVVLCVGRGTYHAFTGRNSLVNGGLFSYRGPRSRTGVHRLLRAKKIGTCAVRGGNIEGVVCRAT